MISLEDCIGTCGLDADAVAAIGEHEALDAGHIRHAAELFMALRHFLKQHPEAMRGLDADSSSFQCGSQIEGGDHG